MRARADSLPTTVSYPVEFVEFAQAWTKLRTVGVEEVERTPTHLRLGLIDTPKLCVIDVATVEHPRAAELPADLLRLSRSQIANAIAAIVRKLHLAEVLVIPVGKWRQVFDAVSFSLAANDKWREVDSAATVELNTRDPLLFHPADHQTIRDLLLAVMNEGQSDAQGITVATTGAPFLVEVMPVGEVIFFAGTPALGAVISDALGAVRA